VASTLGSILAAPGARLADILQTLRRVAALPIVVVGREGSTSLAPRRVIATIRLHLGIRQGRIFAHGVVPWTPSFVVTEGSGSTPYDLLRID
jgi:hypothetical protein